MSGAGEGGLWAIVNTDDCVQCGIAKLDGDLKVRAEVEVTAGAAAVRVGLGSVWVSNPEEDILEQIDPKTLKVVNRIETGSRPRYMAVGAGSVWHSLRATAASPAIPPKPRSPCASTPV
jgi:streptogramin lyase